MYIKEKSERMFSPYLLHLLAGRCTLAGIPFEIALRLPSLLHEYTMNIIAGGQTSVTGDICVGVYLHNNNLSPCRQNKNY